MVFEQIQKILAQQFDRDESEITEDTLIVEDLGADSLDVYELLMTIENEFELEVPDEEIENIRTVADVVNYIENNQ